MRQMTVERHYTRLPERLGAGKSKTRAACHGGGAKKAVAAMTCPGAIPLKTTFAAERLRATDHIGFGYGDGQMCDNLSGTAHNPCRCVDSCVPTRR